VLSAIISIAVAIVAHESGDQTRRYDLALSNEEGGRGMNQSDVPFHIAMMKTVSTFESNHFHHGLAALTISTAQAGAIVRLSLWAFLVSGTALSWAVLS
jgi:hypothetical protein